MSVAQQTGSMQAATLRCPPGVFRERYTLADFEVTHTYGEGPNWSISAARCKWSSEQVVLQTYTEVGNLSGCMAMALAAAHSLTSHPAFLPLYAVFRDVATAGGAAAAAPGGAAAAAGEGAGGGGTADRIVMVYPGGPAQHPLDAGCPPSSSSAGSPTSSLGGVGVGGGCGSGPPVSERGVVRGLLQPLSELVTVLGSMGLRPPYVCGLDVWMDSPEAPGPGQALFMVPLMCHRRAHSPPEALLPAALPYAAPYLRANPSAAGDQAAADEGQAKRWLSWSAAALVHTVLIGSPPPEKPAGRKSRIRPASDAPDATVPQLPPLNSAPSNGAPARTSLLMSLATPRQGGMLLLPPSGVAGGGAGGGASATNGDGLAAGGKASGGGGGGPSGSSSRRSSSSTKGGADTMPLWLSDEAGDWFRRGLGLDCALRAPLDEQMRHPWVSRHAVPRSVSVGNILKRESLGSLPRELHPLMLDMVPMGLVKPGREEVETLMADLAAHEGPSAAKPAMPWQVVEGPRGAGPDVVVVDEFSPPEYNELEPDDRDTSVVERYEVAEEQKDDGTRIVEELRVVSGKPDGALTRAAKALQAAMARRAEAQTGQWVMANPRGATFDDIARQNQMMRSSQQQVAVPNAQGQRRASNGAPAPPPSIAARMRSPRASAAAAAAAAAASATGGTAAAAAATASNGGTAAAAAAIASNGGPPNGSATATATATASVRASSTSIASSGAASRHRSPGPRAAARVSIKPAKAAR